MTIGFKQLKMDLINNTEINMDVSHENLKILSKNSKTNILHTKIADKYIGLKLTNLKDFKKIISSKETSKNQTVPQVSEGIKQNLHKFCRTCAEKKVPLTDIFSDKGVKKKLNQQIQHLQIINENDILSTKMCMDCICDLKMSYHFFIQIQKAQKKLETIFQSYNEALSKAAAQKKTQSEIKSDLDCTVTNVLESPVKNGLETSSSITSELNISDLNIESKNPVIDNTCDLNDTISVENESLTEFDSCIIDEGNTGLSDECNLHSNTVSSLQDCNDKYNESSNSFKNLQSDEKNPKNESPIKKVTENSTRKEIACSESSKMPNILKRKTSSGNTLNDSNGNSSSSAKENQKLNIDLKDIKIPKLNLENSANVRTEEDGVMYVTAKGSNPNEMLLIKVKKMDKTSDKKHDKLILKKKDVHKNSTVSYKRSDKVSSKGSEIDEQIEEYKKKRAQVLGVTAVTDLDVIDEPEIRQVEQDMEIINLDKFKIENMNNEEKEILAETSEKSKKTWKEIKNKHDVISKDLTEDCTERLQSILKQKDEYIQDFMSYLKQRRIVASRLRDEDIITLYETKNNVTLERPSTQDLETPEDFDPFEFKECFDCDWCEKSFPTRDMELEHSKIHDFKLMHYCIDCKQEFATFKSKRKHNNTCIQKLMCKYCQEVFEAKGKKRQHEQKHCDEQDGQLCDLCGEKFKHTSTLDGHVKSKHMDLEKIFECSECPKKFAQRTKLTFHLKSVHTTSRPFLCEDCGSNFKNPASLRHHRLRKHMTTNNTKECVVCHKMIPIYSMSKHMNTHKAYTIKCNHCEKMFKNSSTLKQHLRIHEDMRQYKCDMCGVGFNRRDGLRLHLKVHEKTDSRGLKECSCQICGEKFPNHSTLVIHRNRTHKDGKTYTCHICNRSMISPRSLEWHLANIHNELLPGNDKDEPGSIDAETKRVTCYHCQKTFKTEMILRTHIKNTHTEKEPMKCLDCDQVFMSEVRLRHHMMVEHERYEGTLVCPHCPKRFVNQLRLKTHMIAHSDERPHTCDICGFNLKTKIQLIKHKQNRHSNERPLKCKYCSWRCKQVSALVCHQRTHTNERPYSCSVCKQRFKYLGDKNKHERRHESLGGTGFKRIVTGRNTSRGKQADFLENEPEHLEEVYHVDLNMETQENDEYEEKIEGDLDFEETSVKLENENLSQSIIDEGSQSSFEPVYDDGESQDTHNPDSVVLGVEETVYTEEVTEDHIEPEIITADMIHETVLQSGTTVVHLEQHDENGKVQMIPVMLSLPDLTDTTSAIDLENASIIYES